MMCTDASIYLENLKIELNSLSKHHLSMNTISPQNLRAMLMDVKSKLSNNFQLPEDPLWNIWYYYRSLDCITYFQNNRIEIVLDIPLLNTKESFDIFRVYSFPLPLIPILESKTKGSQFTANFRLESEAIMISQDRTQYSLLSEHEYQLCANQEIKQCLITSARYKTIWNKHCVVAMFVNEQDRMKESCTKVVSQNQGLPLVQYISSVLVIVTDERLKLVIACREKESQNEIEIVPPVGIVRLNNSCRASSKYFDLPDFYEKTTSYKNRDIYSGLLKLTNVSKFHIWDEFHNEFPNITSKGLPSNLTSLKEIPMSYFIHQIQKLRSNSNIFGTQHLNEHGGREITIELPNILTGNESFPLTRNEIRPRKTSNVRNQNDVVSPQEADDNVVIEEGRSPSTPNVSWFRK